MKNLSKSVSDYKKYWPYSDELKKKIKKSNKKEDISNIIIATTPWFGANR